MDDLLREFLTETSESLDTVDNQLVRFEQDPSDAKILDNIFRLVHTIKGTCGFLGLPRLEALAHAGETLMGKFRDGMPVKAEAVTLILSSIDRIKEILAGLEATETEPEGTDEDLIEQLHAMAEGGSHAEAEPAPAPVVAAPPVQPAIDVKGTLVEQVLERPLRPGEVSLDDLERAFRETETEVAPAAPEPRQAGSQAVAAERRKPPRKPPRNAKEAAKAKPAKRAAVADTDVQEADKIANQSIRVNVDTLEHLMTMVSELVLTRNQLLEISRRNEDTEFKVPLQRLVQRHRRAAGRRHEDADAADRQCLAEAAAHRPRPLRRTRQADRTGDARRRHRTRPAGARPDQGSVDAHGAQLRRPRPGDARPSGWLAARASRAPSGFPPITRAATSSSASPTMAAGSTPSGSRPRRLQNGLVSEAELEKMTEAQIHKFIFAPGFSTAAAVTSVSGRGVGMDVVRTNIDQIGGTIDIKSVAGEGSSVTIKIPLTLAIVSALIVEAAGDRFAIPQLSVVELVRARANSEHRIERIKDTAVLRLRNKLLPLMHLKKLLKIDDGSSSDPENGFIVVTQVGSQTFGIVVDGVFHTEEIVVKPMSTKLRHIDMFSGNTILGDGAVIMIIDPNGIAKALGAAGSVSNEISDENAASHASMGEQLTSLLVFRAGSSQPKAVPLGLVTRLEEIATDKIELSNGRYMVQYRDQLMPLVQMNGVTVQTPGLAADPGVRR